MTEFKITKPTEIDFLGTWAARRLAPATVTDLLIYTPAAELELPAASLSARRSRLGRWLAKHRNARLRTPVGDFRVVSAGIYEGRQRWEIESVETAAIDDADTQ